jgi:alpha-1,6-mannosyltransferase
MATHVPAPDGSVALPRARELVPGADRLREVGERWLGTRPTSFGVRRGRAALAAIAAGVLAVVLVASAGSSVLVPHSTAEFPGWDAGPLRLLVGHLAIAPDALTLAYSGLLVLLTVAYLIAVLAAPSLSLRVIVGVIVALNVILLMAPPLQLNDVFNYLGYARLGALHGFNPYTHTIRAETFDPVYRFASWRHYHDPYGQLFTALTYPLAFLPLPVAYWVIKVATVATGLGFLGCLAVCARRLGRDPRTVLAIVALNPIYLFFMVGAFHNDFFMLLPSTAAILMLLQRRDRSAGVLLACAIAVKFTAVLLLPFLLMAARPQERRLRVLAGVVLAAVPLAALSLALFGTGMPNVTDQTRVITGYSVPNLLGLLLGFGGGTQTLVRVLNVGVVLVVLWGLRRRDWVAASGWATLALIASLSWLMPWYVVWALPLAALSSSPALRRVAIAFMVFLILTFTPEWGTFLGAHGVNPMNTAVGQAATSFQAKLQGN